MQYSRAWECSYKLNDQPVHEQVTASVYTFLGMEANYKINDQPVHERVMSSVLTIHQSDSYSPATAHHKSVPGKLRNI